MSGNNRLVAVKGRGQSGFLSEVRRSDTKKLDVKRDRDDLSDVRIGDLKVREFIDLFRPAVVTDAEHEDTLGSHPSVELAILLKSDSDAANAWHDNIAVALQDSGVGYKKSQRAAVAVMGALFGVDTSRHATEIIKNHDAVSAPKPFKALKR